MTEWDRWDPVTIRTHPHYEERSCRGMDPSVFFPKRGDDAGIITAKKVCASCPIKRECAVAFIEEPVGVFGGGTLSLRRVMRVERRKVLGGSRKLTCVMCGNPFAADNHKRMYCGDECTEIARRKTQESYRQRRISL